MNQIELQENYGYKRTNRGVVSAYNGEVEIIIKDARNGQVLEHRRVHNIVKVFMKEILSHCLPSHRVWEPGAGTGAGDWVNTNLALDDYNPKYICFGASFDNEGIPLDSGDDRYYTHDTVSGGFVPVVLGVGAEFGGGLINAIPISEPNIPLKRVERIYFESSYQPAGSPLLEKDVRAINNIVVFETTLRSEEYNGFGMGGSNFFTITEVALVAAKETPPAQGTCECNPRTLFLEGNENDAIDATASGTATISLDSDVDISLLDTIIEGNQVKIVAQGGLRQDPDIAPLDQITPYYLVISKALGGRDIVLDRTPVDADNVPITGAIGVFKDGFRIACHRILPVPVRKSSMFEIVFRWRILLN